MIKTVADLFDAFKQQEDEKLHGKGITHPTTIGDMYEGLTAEIQQRTLPCDGINVVSGFAKDHTGKLSKQLDCMLVVGDGEELPYVSKRVYLLDQIIAVTEVKKTLYTEKLNEAHDNLSSIMDLKPSQGRRLMATVHRAFQDLTGRTVPLDPATLPPMLQSIYHMLVVEAGWPLRIVLGFRGYANEATFRKGILDFLKENVKKQGYGPMSLPGFIIGPNAVAIKNVSMPWGSPIDVDGSWPLLQTNGFLKPVHVLLEAIWSRLSCLGFIDDSAFGEDLEVEVWNRLIDCRPLPEIGWEYDAYPAKVAAYGEDSVKEWRPFFVSEAEYAIVVALRNKSLNLNELGSDFELRAAVDSLIQKRIIGSISGEPHMVSNLLHVPMCVRLPDQSYAIGENNSGRMVRWCGKHFPGVKIAISTEHQV
jgi:hypothetical protein